MIEEDSPPPDSPPGRARLALTSLIIALAAMSVIYRLLHAAHLEHTALLFIGIPTALALISIRGRPSQTATGTIVRTIWIALCMSGILLAEGFVCILFAAPLALLVGLVIGKVIDARRRRGREGRQLLILLGVGLSVSSLEGARPTWSLPRDSAVSVTRDVDLPADSIAIALARPMRFDLPLPRFFQLGFPTPHAEATGGLDSGTVRMIHFAHGHHAGTLLWRVTERDAGGLRFSAVSDDSYIIHWLSWRDATVRWTPLGDHRARVTWTLRYRRRLDPAWYFAPIERYAVHLAAGYLIESMAERAQ
ncbi:MAG: hypothetical protein M3081_06350 [Gemmatimonadota bacterium]|nr:hypothetical protein [Gemmatimonadota bacterium]